MPCLRPSSRTTELFGNYVGHPPRINLALIIGSSLFVIFGGVSYASGKYYVFGDGSFAVLNFLAPSLTILVCLIDMALYHWPVEAGHRGGLNPFYSLFISLHFMLGWGAQAVCLGIFNSYSYGYDQPFVSEPEILIPMIVICAMMVWTSLVYFAISVAALGSLEASKTHAYVEKQSRELVQVSRDTNTNRGVEYGRNFSPAPEYQDSIQVPVSMTETTGTESGHYKYDETHDYSKKPAFQRIDAHPDPDLEALQKQSLTETSFMDMSLYQIGERRRQKRKSKSVSTMS